jgi:hypothetical protein
MILSTLKNYIIYKVQQDFENNINIIILILFLFVYLLLSFFSNINIHISKQLKIAYNVLIYFTNSIYKLYIKFKTFMFKFN